MNETVEFTNLCMVRDSDRVLVMDRKKEDWPGITFPGGHVEAGESFTEAVIREVKEETGLRIASSQMCGMKDWVEDDIRYVVLFYKTEKFEGDLIYSEEGEVWWENLKELPNLDLSLDMEDMLRIFLEEDLSEFSTTKMEKTGSTI
ncbi:DNA mismatch repair protein MutT [Streptococcus parasanguinis]|nr:8-oxo-dGTP diphosphatase [Streptococcus parasanguinis]PKZ97657.1 DNA mismatch repair protein MutT [Streptococcus parasanguinis]